MTLDSAQWKTESGLPNKWDVKLRLHGVPASPRHVFHFTVNFYPKWAQTSMKSTTLCTLQVQWARTCLLCAEGGGNFRVPLKHTEYMGSSSGSPQRWTEMCGDVGQFPNSALFSQGIFRGITLQDSKNEHSSQYQRWGKCKYCLWESTRQRALGSHQQINHMPDLEATSMLQIWLHSELCPGTRTCHWKTVCSGLIEIGTVTAV